MERTFREDFQELLSTAWPLMLSTGLFSITMFVDRLMLYKHSDGAAAAAMSAGTTFWALTCLPVGICGYTSTFVSQYLGVKRLDRAIQTVWQAAILAILIAPILILFAINSERFFLWCEHSPETASLEATFFVWLIPGAISTVIGSAFVGLFAGSGRTMVLLYCDAAVTAINASLDVVLIFGKLGFPKLGVAGAAIASSIALTLKLVLLLFFAWGYLKRGQFGSFPVEHTKQGRTDLSSVSLWHQLLPLLSFDLPLMKRLIQYGWPAGVSVVAESWSFMVIMMKVGRLGDQPAAATTLALGVNLLAFIPLIGLGMAVGVLVGKYLVQNNIRMAKRMVYSGLIIGVGYSLFFVIFYGGMPDTALNIYALGTEPERFEEMRPVLRPLLMFIAGYCVFDALQLIFAGVLKGAGDTYFVLLGHLLTGASTVIGALLISSIFGFDDLYYWWAVISVWVILLALVFTLRFLQGGWQTKRVIEAQIIEVAAPQE